MNWGRDFTLDRVLAHGTLPGIYADRDPEGRSNTLRSYVDAYLREEIQAEALVRDIGGYSRLLDLAAASSGRVVNLHALSRDAAVSYETARRHLDVLEDTLILFRLPAWRGVLHRRESTQGGSNSPFRLRLEIGWAFLSAAVSKSIGVRQGSRFYLDAFAWLAWLQEEPGAPRTSLHPGACRTSSRPHLRRRR